jgi:hypothetical protein
VATFSALAALGAVIKELGEVPSGHLYARLCDRLTLEQYNGFVAMLVRAGVVSQEAHVLRWIGGE